MLEHTPPSMAALAGIELALEHVNLVKPLTKKDLLDLQSECLDAPLPFNISIKAWPARESFTLIAHQIPDDEDKWNWNVDYLCQIELYRSGIDTIQCARLHYHKDSLEGAQKIQLALTVLLKKASLITDRFGDCLALYETKTILDR